MESTSMPPRYEDVVYPTKANAQQDVNIGIPPAVLPATVQPTMQPTVQPTMQPTVQPTMQPTVQPIVQESVSTARVILNVVNTLTHFFLGAIVFCAFMIATQGPVNYSYSYYYQSSFSQHIFLCVTGYMILLSQAVLSFSPHGGWAHGLTHPQKQLCYGAMQILGSSLALAGCFAKITDWNQYPMSTSVHAIIGWIVMLLTILSLIGGIVDFKYADIIKQGPYKSAHSHLFLLTLTMAFICLAIAFSERYYFYNGVFSGVAVSFTVFALIGVLISEKFKYVQ